MPLNDKHTGADVGVELEHHLNHIGKAFIIEKVYTLASGATKDFVFETPAEGTFEIHIVPDAKATLKLNLKLYEDTEADADGTLVTPLCRNRAHPTSSSVVVREDPTVTAVGTLLLEHESGTATGATGAAASSREADEITLGYSKKYRIRLTSGANSNVVTTKIRWYELKD